ncbi:MAG: hypothetical protein GY796_10300 [Chloroflexi bacterium]|nr:hypothetical protein [Chloroflexota bacterium]
MTTPLQHRNQALFRRTVALTEAAIEKLEAEGETVTLTSVAGATRDIDTEGRGISQTTIVRNPDALAIFRQHSPAYQKKVARKARQTQNKPSQPVVDQYQALDRLDLIQMIEALQAENARLNARLSELQTERDTAYHLRDEALQQNARQLAKLAELM